MLEIQTKNVHPDIVVLEIVGRITLGSARNWNGPSKASWVRDGRKLFSTWPA